MSTDPGAADIAERLDRVEKRMEVLEMTIRDSGESLAMRLDAIEIRLEAVVAAVVAEEDARAAQAKIASELRARHASPETK